MAQKEIKDVNELSAYEKHYSDSNFWDKVKSVAGKAGEKVIRTALILFYCMKSSNTNVKDKAIIIGALGYFILPVDLIPDIIPVLGFTDDLAALTLAYNSVKKSATPDVVAQADTKVKEWFA